MDCSTEEPDFDLAELVLALILGLLALPDFGDRVGEVTEEPKNSMRDRVYVRSGFGEVTRVSLVGSKGFGRM